MPEIPATIPTWAVVLLAATAIVGSLAAGYHLARLEQRRARRYSESLISDLTAASLGLLGLMLAFTFGWTATRFDDRLKVRIAEAQALGRLFWLADFLPPNDRAQLRVDIRRYVDASLAAHDISTLETSIRERLRLQQDMWRIASAAGRRDFNSQIASDIVRGANDVITAHLTRDVLGAVGRIPRGILVGLLAILILSMAMVGYQVGLTESLRTPAVAAVIVALTLVVFLIAHVDRPLEGRLGAADRPLEQLARELRTWQ